MSVPWAAAWAAVGAQHPQLLRETQGCIPGCLGCESRGARLLSRGGMGMAQNELETGI